MILGFGLRIFKDKSKSRERLYKLTKTNQTISLVELWFIRLTNHNSRWSLVSGQKCFPIFFFNIFCVYIICIMPEKLCKPGPPPPIGGAKRPKEDISCLSPLYINNINNASYLSCMSIFLNNFTRFKTGTSNHRGWGDKFQLIYCYIKSLNLLNKITNKIRYLTK